MEIFMSKSNTGAEEKGLVSNEELDVEREVKL